MDFKNSRLKFFIGALILAVFIAPLLWRRLAMPRRVNKVVLLFNPTENLGISGIQRTYATSFPLDENPISENGSWTVSNGDFANVRTAAGVAFGTQSGTKAAPGKYDDSTALLTGNWGPDQFVQIVVHYTGAPTDGDYDEVEIRLRSSITPTSNTGYEINCRVGRPGNDGYIQVGKINGPIGDFPASFDEKHGPEYLCHDGDVITGTIVGKVLKAYINGKQVLEAYDSTYATGAPGIGFYHEKVQAQNSDFGISSVFVSDHMPWQGGTPPVGQIQK